jgi:hypothetical protein
MKGIAELAESSRASDFEKPYFVWILRGMTGSAAATTAGMAIAAALTLALT